MTKVGFRNAAIYVGNTIMAALFPAVFLLCNNSAEMRFTDISQYVVFSMLLALIIFCVCAVFFRSPAVSSVYTVILLLFLQNYRYIENLVQSICPVAKYWHIVPCLIVLLGMGFVFCKKNISIQAYREVNKVILIALGVMTGINIVPALPTLISREASNGSGYMMTDSSIKPNVYWLTFDECASFEVIEEYYHFDAGKYKTKLDSLGFTISHECDNTYIDTVTIMTNCMALEQVVDNDTAIVEKERLRKNSVLATRLSQMGYKMVGVGDTEWLGFESVTEDGVTLGATMGGETAMDLLVKQSAFSPFYNKPNSAFAESILNVFTYFEDKEQYAPNSAVFYVVYACSPHVPFLFDKYGIAVSPSNYENWADPQYYLGQYEFIMNEIMVMLDNIIENDPNSIVILSSDHGPRSYSPIREEDKSRNLMAVYAFGDREKVIEGNSTIDILKKTLEIIENGEGGEEHESI